LSIAKINFDYSRLIFLFRGPYCNTTTGATRTPAQLAGDEKRPQILRRKREVAAAAATKAKKKTKIPAIRACRQSLFVPPASLSLTPIEEDKDTNKNKDKQRRGRKRIRKLRQ